MSDERLPPRNTPQHRNKPLQQRAKTLRGGRNTPCNKPPEGRSCVRCGAPPGEGRVLCPACEKEALGGVDRAYVKGELGALVVLALRHGLDLRGLLAEPVRAAVEKARVEAVYAALERFADRVEAEGGRRPVVQRRPSTPEEDEALRRGTVEDYVQFHDRGIAFLGTRDNPRLVDLRAEAMARAGGFASAGALRVAANRFRKAQSVTTQAKPRKRNTRKEEKSQR